MKKFFPKYLSNQPPFDPAKLPEQPLYLHGRIMMWPWASVFLGKSIGAYRYVKHWLDLAFKNESTQRPDEVSQTSQGQTSQKSTPVQIKQKNMVKLQSVWQRFYDGVRYWFFRTGDGLRTVPEELVRLHDPLTRFYDLAEIIAKYNYRCTPMTAGQLAQIQAYLEGIERETCTLLPPYPDSPKNGGGTGYMTQKKGFTEPKTGAGATIPYNEADDPFAGLPREKDVRNRQRPPDLHGLFIQVARYLIKIVNQDKRMAQKLEQQKREPVRSRKPTSPRLPKQVSPSVEPPPKPVDAGSLQKSEQVSEPSVERTFESRESTDRNVRSTEPPLVRSTALPDANAPNERAGDTGNVLRRRE